jgi:hypothetical protein
MWFILPLNTVVIEYAGKFLFYRVDELNVARSIRVFQKAPPAVTGNLYGNVLLQSTSL